MIIVVKSIRIDFHLRDPKENLLRSEYRNGFQAQVSLQSLDPIE